MSIDWDQVRTRLEGHLETDDSGMAAARASEILGRRAASLAERSDQPASALGAGAWLEARSGDDRLAFRLDQLTEVLRPKQLTSVPGTPSVVGVLNRRGVLVAVVDFAQVLSGRPPRSVEAAREGLVLVLRDEPTTGLLIDEVAGIRKWTAAAEARASASTVVEPPLSGRTTEGIGLVDLAAVLAHPLIQLTRGTHR